MDVILPNDLIKNICYFLDAKSLFSMLQTCKQFDLDDTFFKNYCYNIYGVEFWENARVRPKKFHSASWKEEYRKIEFFQVMVEKLESRRWQNDDFYRLWQTLS